MDADVLIVGGGPTGLGLALELGQRGVSVALVERYPSPQRIPKGQNLTQRTMEHLAAWGAAERVRAARTIPKSYGIGGLTAYGTLLSGYHYDWLQRELVRPFYSEDNERLPQYGTEGAMRERLSEIACVTTHYGWAAEQIGQDADGVTVDMTDRSAARKTLRGKFVVGCDGSRSRVREASGITETADHHGRKMVLLVFRSTGLHSLLERFPGKSYYSVLDPKLEGYWKFFGRVDLGTTWFFHAPVPLETTRDNFDFTGLLQGAVGATFDVEFEHIGFWDMRIAVANNYRAGRIFLAGDAAHSHPPYGGYGINTSLEDARNLGWKLAATLQGWGGGGLLDSYSDERRPVFQSTADEFIDGAIRSDRVFVASFDPARDKAAFEDELTARATGARADVGAFEPNYEGSHICFGSAAGRSSAVGTHLFAGRAGHHLAPQPLSRGGTTFDVLGLGFTLLAFDANESSIAAFVEAAKKVHVPLSVVRDTRADGRERYEAELVLVRPDQFVAWAGHMRDGVAPMAILARASGQV